MAEALFEMSSKALGMTCVVDDNKAMLGLFTDGDLRRALDSEHNIQSTAISEVMTKNPQYIDAEILAAEALSIMEEKQISALVVVDSNNRPTGVLHLHDLLKAGVA